MSSLQTNFGCASVMEKSITYENNDSCKQRQVIVQTLQFILNMISALTLSGPGGGSEARMAKLTAANQKPVILLCPNLVTFSFYP